MIRQGLGAGKRYSESIIKSGEIFNPSGGMITIGLDSTHNTQQSEGAIAIGNDAVKGTENISPKYVVFDGENREIKVINGFSVVGSEIDFNGIYMGNNALTAIEKYVKINIHNRYINGYFTRNNTTNIVITEVSNEDIRELDTTITDTDYDNYVNELVTVGSSQGLNSIAIGYDAASNGQGDYCIAIGPRAGKGIIQNNNTIILNAQDVSLSSVYPNSLYIAPIRESKKGNVLGYDTSTKEITYYNLNDKLDLKGGAMSGTLDMCNNKINNVSEINSSIVVKHETDKNMLYFTGVSSDEPTSMFGYHSGLIEQIYERSSGGSHKSELLIFKGNDPEHPRGPDRIKLYSHEIVFSVETNNNRIDSNNLDDSLNNIKVTIQKDQIVFSEKLDMSGNSIKDVGDGVEPKDVVNKSQLDGKLDKSGGGVTGQLNLNNNRIINIAPIPIMDREVTAKVYVDNGLNNKLNLTGGTLTDDLDMSGNNIKDVGDGVDPKDVVNKSQLDNVVTMIDNATTDVVTALSGKLDNNNGIMNGKLFMLGDIQMSGYDILNVTAITATLLNVTEITATEITPIRITSTIFKLHSTILDTSIFDSISYSGPDIFIFEGLIDYIKLNSITINKNQDKTFNFNVNTTDTSEIIVTFSYSITDNKFVLMDVTNEKTAEFISIGDTIYMYQITDPDTVNVIDIFELRLENVINIVPQINTSGLIIDNIEITGGNLFGVGQFSAETIRSSNNNNARMIGFETGGDQNIFFFEDLNMSGHDILNAGTINASNISNFTGTHICEIIDISNNTIDIINNNPYFIPGLVVSSNGVYKDISINDSLPQVSISNIQYDKKCLGIISDTESGKNIYVNSLGEGGIWMCDINGDLENGDYITSSNIPGFAMKQTVNEGFLTNFTVGKITCDCNFNDTSRRHGYIKIYGDRYEVFEFKNASEDCQVICIYYFNFKTDTHNYLINKTFKIEFVGCTYHCG